MKNILTLAGSLFLAGCMNTSMPKFPDTIKEHYMIDVHGEQKSPTLIQAIVNIEEIPPTEDVVRCIKFEIVSSNPYKIKFVAEVALKECNGVGGYKPEDSVSFFNWVQDIFAWAEKRKNCFK